MYFFSHPSALRYYIAVMVFNDPWLAHSQHADPANNTKMVYICSSNTLYTYSPLELQPVNSYNRHNEHDMDGGYTTTYTITATTLRGNCSVIFWAIKIGTLHKNSLTDSKFDRATSLAPWSWHLISFYCNCRLILYEIIVCACWECV